MGALILCPIMLSLVHGVVPAGHFGVKKMLGMLPQQFCWPGCQQDAKLFGPRCDVCVARRGASHGECGGGHPGSHFSIKAGNCYISVAIDYLTQWPEANAVPNQSATTTVRPLEKFSCRSGAPEELHGDQSRNFEAQAFGKGCKQPPPSILRQHLLCPHHLHVWLWAADSCGAGVWLAPESKMDARIGPPTPAGGAFEDCLRAGKVTSARGQSQTNTAI